MKLFAKLAILFILLATLVTACEERDKFSSDSNLKLEFSTDTLRFDTVFTSIASPVQQIKIYNRNNNSISFESIELMNAEKTGFRINVDGQAGTQFEGVDLLRKDSIYIMADAKLNETKGSDILVTDAICLKWNGNTHYIQLGAYGLNVEVWNDKVIDSNTKLNADTKIFLRGALTINEGASLEIEEGTTFYLDRKASITINGTIKARGTTQKPINFRTHRFDFIERNILYNNAPGQWKGITVGANSYNNSFENVRIIGAEKGLDFLASNTSQQKATLLNTMIHHTTEFGLRAINSKIDATNCLFSNSKGSLLNLIGGNYTFLHCTIANYYAWHARTAVSVVLANNSGGNKYTLEKCEFKNSIIVGSSQNEISASLDDGASFKFSNCVIQAAGKSKQPQFENIIWNVDSPFLFKNLNEKKLFNYSFELIEGSSAIETANPAFAKDAPNDLRGIARNINKADIGAYEWNE